MAEPPNVLGVRQSTGVLRVDSPCEATLPIGVYDLVAARGPEYRLAKRRVDVRANETTTIRVALQRYADLPGAGWYSGDSHIHLMRDQAADMAVWGQLAAEDVHVGNLLEMGNIAGTYSSSRRGIAPDSSSATATRSSPDRKIRGRACAVTRFTGT